MPTIGELVRREVGILGAEPYAAIFGEGVAYHPRNAIAVLEHRARGQALIDLLIALQELGLWDAEVLEVNATSGPGWMDVMEPVSDDGEGEPIEFPEGRIRIIVLPKKGDE